MDTSVRGSNLAQKLDSPPEDTTPRLAAFESTSTSNHENAGADPLDEVTLGKTKRQHIRDFGFVIAWAMTIVAAYKLYHRGNLVTIVSLSAAAALFSILCAWAPKLMTPAFKGWMSFAKVLEVVMTRVILGVMWMVTFFPIGLVFRMLGKSPVTLGFDKARASYWENCDKKRADFSLLERQY